MNKKPVLKKKWFLRYQEGYKVEWFVWKWAVYEWDDFYKKMIPWYYNTEAEAKRFLGRGDG